jgi:hypothetical protein
LFNRSCTDFLPDIFSTEFASIAHSAELLEKLEALIALDGRNPTSSDNVIAFLDRIENADPDASDLSDDDKDASWGHHQFTAGSMRIASVLVDWQAVGSTSVAFQLIAAAVKTCRVARHLCFKKSIDCSSFLSDNYLELLVERLWNLVKDIKVPTAVQDSGTVPSSGALSDAEKAVGATLQVRSHVLRNALN